jgi:CO/xanthine dehydrogenase FAD-binding subunit
LSKKLKSTTTICDLLASTFDFDSRPAEHYAQAKMNNLDYIVPQSLEDALKIKHERGAEAQPIAGGTDLILRLRDKALSPKVLVDLHRLSLDQIRVQSDGIRLGPCVTLSQILQNSSISTGFPALIEACRPFAGPPIRNRATIGGNLVNASPAADLTPCLMAYDASVTLTSSSATRVIPLTEFFIGPGQTVLSDSEILTEIHLPSMPQGTRASFIKLGQRRSMAISIVNVCALISSQANGHVATARIALGAVAPTTIRAVAAESVLEGRSLSPERIDQAAENAAEVVAPIDDVRASKTYRRKMIKVLVRRALLTVLHDLGRTEPNE